MTRETDVTAIWTKVRTCEQVGRACSRCGFDQRFEHYVNEGRPHCARCFLNAVGAQDVNAADLDGFVYVQGKLVLVINEPQNFDNWPIGEVRNTQFGMLRRRSEPLYSNTLDGKTVKEIADSTKEIARSIGIFRDLAPLTPFRGFPPGFDPHLRTWKPGDPCPRCGSRALGAEGGGTHQCLPPGEIARP